MNAESIHSRWLIPLYNLCNRKLALQALSAINLYGNITLCIYTIRILRR